MAREYIPVTKYHTIVERAGGRCEYCQSRADYTTESFAVEHIFPVSRGGTSEMENLAFCCSGCNGRKHNKISAFDPTDGQPAPLYHPRQQRWSDHFRWINQYTQVLGLTPTGRATVEALKMNRPALINIRRVLFLTGQHPPGNFDL